MKRFLLIVLTLALFIPAAFGGEFLGSNQSDKYHLPDCKWAKKITKENRVVFPSAVEAIRAGYKPCKVCRPPAGKERGEKEDDGQPVGVEIDDVKTGK